MAPDVDVDAAGALAVPESLSVAVLVPGVVNGNVGGCGKGRECRLAGAMAPDVDDAAALAAPDAAAAAAPPVSSPYKLACRSRIATAIRIAYSRKAYNG